MIILGYIIYLSIALFLVFWVGRKLNRDGAVWLDWIFEGHILGVRLNNLLLIGYYLVNMGYTLYTIQSWNYSNPPIVEALQKTGVIALILSYLHYQNIIVIYFFQHFKLIEKWK